MHPYIHGREDLGSGDEAIYVYTCIAITYSSFPKQAAMLIDMLSALSLIFMSEIRANYIPYEGTDILVMNVITCFHLFQEFPNN